MRGRLTGALVFVVAACNQYPDIAGRSSEAQEWAARERAAEAKRSERATLERQRSNSRIDAAQGSRAEESRPPIAPRRPPPIATSADRGPPQSTEIDASTPVNQKISTGTCFAIDAHGTLATAAHVVRGSRTIVVAFSGQASTSTAMVVSSSEATDIAILRIERSTPDFIAIAQPQTARVGTRVFTMGFPDVVALGTEPKFTDGAISALSGVRDASLMQITVPIQSGNSGGPLVDERGEVLGIIISTIAPGQFIDRTGGLPQNVNFATKAENLSAVLRAAPAKQKPARSWEDAIERTGKAVCLVVASLE